MLISDPPMLVVALLEFYQISKPSETLEAASRLTHSEA